MSKSTKKKLQAKRKKAAAKKIRNVVKNAATKTTDLIQVTYSHNRFGKLKKK